MVDEYGARSVLDVGCGTGTFACLLARRGIGVVGVDPALASLDVAQRKLGADRVTWIHGDAAALPADLRVDLAVMTGNVAQVFLTDQAWADTLRHVRAAVRSGGRLVFETRDPARRAWEDWTPEHSRVTTDVEGVGRVESWIDLLAVDPPYVSFRGSVRFESDGALLTSDSTLRFRTQDEIERSLAAAGFDVEEVRDAPDRPGREWVYVARARGAARIGA
ncbi:class I SAM-dependent methyltransferase [Nocardioides sp. LHG3406-4]|uniref:class I SAM-dependent methyltransferase n=1 Tax=Nocardioides sp. LHG3406-4 TaxID=2804575 RepID=UPI003CEFEB07